MGTKNINNEIDEEEQCRGDWEPKKVGEDKVEQCRGERELKI